MSTEDGGGGWRSICGHVLCPPPPSSPISMPQTIKSSLNPWLINQLKIDSRLRWILHAQVFMQPGVPFNFKSRELLGRDRPGPNNTSLLLFVLMWGSLSITPVYISMNHSVIHLVYVREHWHLNKHVCLPRPVSSVFIHN